MILTFFEEWQNGPGGEVQFGNRSYLLEKEGEGKGIGDKINPVHLGFCDLAEMMLYLGTMLEQGYLIGYATSGNQIKGDYYTSTPHKIRLSFSGLNYCLSLLSSGKDSTRCFVAMKYSADMVPYYDEGIAKAVEDNGFRPIRVDREHADSEQTINDFIIASIKQSRFCVADLTHQSHGAYFEAGYALGRGLKVIYTCHEKDWKKLHFDVKSFQVLKYASVEELREKLSLKIQAFVLD